MIDRKERIDERALSQALFITRPRSEGKKFPTIRDTSKKFGVSKTTTHLDLTKRLPRIDPIMAERVAAVLRYNKSMGPERGGKATKRKYETAQ